MARRGWCAPFIPSKAVCALCAALRGWRVCCLIWGVSYLGWVRTFRGKYVEAQFSKSGWGAPPGPCASWVVSLVCAFRFVACCLVIVCGLWWLVFSFLVSKASWCGGPGESRRGVFRGECYTVLPPIFEVGNAFGVGPVCFVVGMRSSIRESRC